MKGLRFKVALFKHTIVKGDIEERRRREQELREALAELGLDADDINYLVASFKRYVEVEQAYKRKCEEIQEVREMINKIYHKLF
jgi:coenzyme F420-reducing hydrogenase delta subunit